jgi:hypothetical protein
MGNNLSCCSNERDNINLNINDAHETFFYKTCLHTLSKPALEFSNEGKSINFDTQKASYTENKNLIIFDFWSKKDLFS